MATAEDSFGRRIGNSRDLGSPPHSADSSWNAEAEGGACSENGLRIGFAVRPQERCQGRHGLVIAGHLRHVTTSACVRRRENQAGGKSSATPTDRGITKRSTFRINLASFNVNHGTLDFVQVGFTPRQVTRLTGVPYSTLNLWAKKELVLPSVAAGKGSGSERIYSFSDLIALKVAFELRKAGVTTRSIEKVVDFVRENEGLQKPLSEARLLVSGRDVLVVRNGRQLVSALSKPGQSCLSFVVDLPRTLGELVRATQSSYAFGLVVAQGDSNGSVPRKQPASVRRTSRKRRRN